MLVNDLISHDPNQFGALIERGHLRRKRGDHVGAADAFEAALAIEPNHVGLRLEWVRDLRALNRLDQAETLVNELLSQDPTHFGALVERGHLRRKRSDHAGAAEAFEAAAAIEPNHVGLRLEWARELRALDRFDEADRILTALLDGDPRSFGALIEQGHLRRQRADHAGAAKAFEAAAAIEPQHIGVSVELVRELIFLKELTKVDPILRSLLERNPTDPSTATGIAHILMERHWLSEAEALLLNAHQNAPTNASVLLALSRLARQRGNRIAGLRYLSIAAELDKTNLVIQLELAAELGAQGRTDEAMELIRAVIAIDDQNYSAWRQLGLHYRSTGEPQQAKGAFDTARKLDPSKIDALVDLAQANLATGDLHEADRLLVHALALEPNHFGALIAAAENALQAEDLENAAGFAGRARTFHPHQLGAHLLFARIAAENLNYEQAYATLDDALTIFGSQPPITATQIFFLRQQRQHNKARLVAAAAFDKKMPFALWSECAALANTLGDFDLTEKVLANSVAEASFERAQLHFFRAQLAEAKRDHRAAIAEYNSALALNPTVGGWHSELSRCHLLLAETQPAYDHLKASMTLDAGLRKAKGQSQNLSQHHVGQILDEFQLDTN
jgi:tetratricopeptide (TPR) repeat protein